MLQIVTRMYFAEEARLNSTVHRAVLYTNRTFLRADLVELPVGELAPQTGIESVGTAMLSVTEHLEAEDADGNSSVLVATSGTELIDDLADLLSFGLNSIFSRDADLVRRLVPFSSADRRPGSGAALFRDTFDPARFVPAEEIEHFRDFMRRLLALDRAYFESSMRAIRRIVRATQRAAGDPTVAYVDLVAAVESLSEGTEVPDLEWNHLERRKRQIFDGALAGADPDLVERIREAVMEAERLGAKRRFVAFVMENLSTEFFRAEATGAVRPIRGPDLERALKLAYDIRSRNIHVLEELPPEAWVLGESSETVWHPRFGSMLSLEGLARLARHVVRTYVRCAPVGVDPTFNWRASLPGILQMRAAPQYWVWMAEGFDPESADHYLSGFLDLVVEVEAGRTEALADMGHVLERIEELLPATNGPKKESLLAIYALWHRLVAPAGHRPAATQILTENAALLETPGLVAFTVGLLTDELPAWSTEEWEAIAAERRTERSLRLHRELPPGLDAALWVLTAEHLAADGRRAEAGLAASNAVEEMPGNDALLAWEAKIDTGEEVDIDLRRLVLGTIEEDSGDEDTELESQGEEDSGNP